MGIIFVDGMDTYADGYDMGPMWKHISSNIDAGDLTQQSTAGPFGGNCMRSIMTSSDEYANFIFPGGARTYGDKIGLAFWVQLSSNIPGGPSLFDVFKITDSLTYLNSSTSRAIGATMATLTVLPDSGDLRLYSGDNVLATASSTLFCDDSWYHIELNYLVDNSVGTYDVYVNGVSVLSATGVDTNDSASSNGFLGCGFGDGVFSTDYIFYDDIIVWDEADDGRDNDLTTFPLGMHRIETIHPNGAGSNTDWTASAGTNWEAVNNNPPSSTDYVSATSSGDRDTYDFGTITTTGSGAIVAVACNAQFRHSDPTVSYADGVIVSSGSTVTNSLPQGSFPQSTESTAGHGAQWIWPADPSSTVAWTTAGIDDLELGFELRKSTT